MSNDESFAESCPKDNSDCNENKSLKSHVGVLNMATHDHVIPNIRGPEIFDGSETKVEAFITSFNRYAKIMGFSEERKILLATPYMTPDAIIKYEAATGETCEEKLRSAFSKEKSILDLMKELVEMRIGSSDPTIIFRKADGIIEKLIEKKLGKKELSNLVYANLIDDENVQKEIAVRGVKKSEEIEDIQTRMFEFDKKKRNAPVAAYNTKRENEWRTVQNKKRTPRPQNEKFIEQETRRNFKVRKITCWACHEEGHVRRECPNVKCSHCNKKGHLRTQCYENPNRFRERDQWKRDNGNNRWNNRQNYSNQRYSERPTYTNKKYSVAEVDELDDELYIREESRKGDYSEGTYRREDGKRLESPIGNRKFRNDQGNEDARSQGEVISVLQ